MSHIISANNIVTAVYPRTATDIKMTWRLLQSVFYGFWIVSVS